ncbi:hypothetical protein BG005_005178, partial [Podila minutissima]
SGAKEKDSTKKRYFEKQESSVKVKNAKKRRMSAPKPTLDSDSSPSSSSSSDSGSDSDRNKDGNSDSDFETTQPALPDHNSSTPARSSASSHHGQVPRRSKLICLPTSKSVHGTVVGNSSMKCNFDVAKRFGCQRCFFQLANESCVSFDTDALQEGMVPAGSWSKVQDGESDAAAVEEEARLATVQEVRAGLKDAGIDSNNVDEWDDLE